MNNDELYEALDSKLQPLMGMPICAALYESLCMTVGDVLEASLGQCPYAVTMFEQWDGLSGVGVYVDYPETDGTTTLEWHFSGAVGFDEFDDKWARVDPLRVVAGYVRLANMLKGRGQSDEGLRLYMVLCLMLERCFHPEDRPQDYQGLLDRAVGTVMRP